MASLMGPDRDVRGKKRGIEAAYVIGRCRSRGVRIEVEILE